ncbi:hypothetical protein [Streptomyces sp. V1I1]|nr:hypothetical protein [Streptomyces sp. V1I1]MDQ0940109.1 hypothetical protein [Streptomyces sp. V1I1]
MREDALVHATTGVHLVHGSNTNWVILTPATPRGTAPTTSRTKGF